MFNCRHAAAAALDAIERKPAPRTLAKVGPASEIIGWLRELAQAANPLTLPCPATPSVGGVGGKP